jgi:putative peptidoglycan lipid II flippase
MVGKIRELLHRETNGLHQAAFLLGSFALASQVLALVRDKLLAASFGAGPELDVYYAAFRVPDFIFVTVGSLVSLSVLIPFIVKAQGDSLKAQTLSDSIATGFLILMACVTVIMFFVMPSLIHVLFPGFGAEELARTTALSRILLLSPLILGISNLLGALSQATGRFFAYAASPVAYNAGIILGIVLLMPKFGIAGAVVGVIMGALLHAAVQIPSTRATGIMPRIRRPNWDIVRDIGALAVPRTIALSMTHISVIFLLSIASGMAGGSIAVFTFAYNLQSVPLSIFGVSYSMAAFPVLSRLLSEGSREEFARKLSHSARHILFWTVPCTALLIVLRAHVVRVVLGAGEFGWSDTRLTAALLAIFAVSLAFQSLALLFIRALYAGGSTGKPFSVSLFSSFVTVAAAFSFARAFHLDPGFLAWFAETLKLDGVLGAEALALPLGFAVGSITDAVLLWILLARQGHKFTMHVIAGFLPVLAASAVGALAAYGTLAITAPIFDLNTFWNVFFQGSLAGVIGAAAFVLLGRLLSIPELHDVVSGFSRKLGRRRNAVSPDAGLT